MLVCSRIWQNCLDLNEESTYRVQFRGRVPGFKVFTRHSATNEVFLLEIVSNIVSIVFFLANVLAEDDQKLKLEALSSF